MATTPSAAEARFDLAEEFDRREVPGNIGRAVGINADHAEMLLGLIEQEATVANFYAEIRHGRGIHVEEFRANRNDLRIEFNPDDRNIAVDSVVLSRNRTRRQTDQHQRCNPIGVKGRIVKVRRRQEVIPCAAVEDFGLMPLAVNALPFIEVEVAVAGGVFLHLNIVVGAFAIVEESGGCRGRAQRTSENCRRQQSYENRHRQI